MFHLRWTSFGKPGARAAPIAVRDNSAQRVCRAVRLLLLGAAVLPARPLPAGVADSWWVALSPRSSAPHPAVVRVVAAERTGVAQGSGTLIAVGDQYGLVLTNWHVVRDATGPVVVVFPDGFQSGARVLKADRDWDLAALMIWRPPAAVQPIPLASVPPRPGEPLTIAGYGTGPYRAVSGRCTQYVSPGVNLPYEMVEVSAAARQGDSGGPILNARGELAGVLFGSSGGTTSGSYSGRVSLFLASLWPAARPGGDASPEATAVANVEKKEEVADSSPAPEPPLRQDTANPPPPSARSSDRNLETGFAAGFSPNASAPPGRTSLSPPPGPTDWARMAGETPLEQAKTLLAGIGLLAVLLQLSRWLSTGEAKPQAKQNA